MASKEVGRRALAQDRAAGWRSGCAGQAGGACCGCAVTLFGTLAHPASPKATPASNAGAARRTSSRIDTTNLITSGIEPAVAWLALEILLGLAAFGLIIWWTLPRGKADDPQQRSTRERCGNPARFVAPRASASATRAAC